MTRGKKIALGCFVFLPLTCCFGGFAYLQYKASSANNRIAEEVKLMQSMGLMTETSEMARNIPPDDNAAEAYIEASNMIANGTQGEADSDAIVTALSYQYASEIDPLDIKETREAYVALKPVYALLEQGAAKPHLEFKRNWSLAPMELLFPELATHKKFVKLLSAKARIQSHEGDYEGSFKTLAAMMRMNHQIGEEPTLIGLLVSIACDSITQVTFQKVVQDQSKNPKALALAKKTLAEQPPLPQFKKALNGEMVMGRSAVQMLGKYSWSQIYGYADDPGSGNEKGAMESFQRIAISNPAVKKSLEATILTGYRKKFEEFPKDQLDFDGMDKMNRDSDAWVQSQGFPMDRLAEIFFPVFEQADRALGNDEGYRRLSATEVRIYEDALKLGHLPTKLPDYGKISIDPLSPTHGRFGYKLGPTGFLLWGVSGDRIDNGGIRTGGPNGQRDQVVDTRPPKPLPPKPADRGGISGLPPGSAG
ncbi:hypothetical protein BH11ARM1_BH11ARM1_09010 [soil metagenome]